jgi:hypothetical protein
MTNTSICVLFWCASLVAQSWKMGAHYKQGICTPTI